MAISEEPTLLYKIFYWIHKIMTSWYVAEIFIFCLVFAASLLLFVILKNWKIYTFLIRDRARFIKHYLYYFTIEKIRFLKSFFYIVRTEFKKYLIPIIIVLIVAIFVFYIIFGVIPKMRPKPDDFIG